MLFDRSRSRNPRQWLTLSSDHAANDPGSTVVQCQGLEQCLSTDRIVDRFNLSTSVHSKMWRSNGQGKLWTESSWSRPWTQANGYVCASVHWRGCNMHEWMLSRSVNFPMDSIPQRCAVGLYSEQTEISDGHSSWAALPIFIKL